MIVNSFHECHDEAKTGDRKPHDSDVCQDIQFERLNDQDLFPYDGDAFYDLQTEKIQGKKNETIG